MSFESVRRAVVQRLDEAPRGDHGWNVLTRVHLNAGRLRALASYLRDVGFEDARSLTATDYVALARIAGVDAADPGVTLRRHSLLAMVTPLRLIELVDGRTWSSLRLTSRGQDLVSGPDTGYALETVLSEIRFCQEPWYSARKAIAYGAFNVRPYEAVVEVVGQTEGWIDPDEHDLFVSRIRTNAEISWAVALIHEFRGFDEAQRDVLLGEVRNRLPGSKPYQNWRDMALHTFSLFSLGTSLLRLNRRLELLLDIERRSPEPRGTVVGRPQRRPPMTLQVPPTAHPDLATPPVAPASNVGTDGELLVGKLLESAGWTVVVCTRTVAALDSTSGGIAVQQALLVEVKSSLQLVSTIALTRLEFEAAKTYGLNYALAIAERVEVRPAARALRRGSSDVLRLTESSTLEYRVRRAGRQGHWWLRYRSAMEVFDRPRSYRVRSAGPQWWTQAGSPVTVISRAAT